MIRPLFPVVASLILLTGCKTPKSSALARPVPGYVYNAPSEKQLNARAAELQKHGYTKDGALNKAKTEFASQAWQTDVSSAEEWAYEKARETRSAANEKMEKDLAKLDRH